MDDKGKAIVGIILVALAATSGILACGYWISQPKIVISDEPADVGHVVNITGEQAISIADDYLRSLGRHPEDDGCTVKKIEVHLDYADVNHYWRDFGKEPPTSYEQRYCWVVTFFFDAHHPNCERLVYVDAETGEVVGGMQCK